MYASKNVDNYKRPLRNNIIHIIDHFCTISIESRIAIAIIGLNELIIKMVRERSNISLRYFGSLLTPPLTYAILAISQMLMYSLLTPGLTPPPFQGVSLYLNAPLN